MRGSGSDVMSTCEQPLVPTNRRRFRPPFFKLYLMENTQIMLPEKKHEIIRMDKNIVKQGLDLVRTYKEDSSMILDIMLYNAHMQQKNLFNLGTLDPYDFAEKLGYKTPNILMKHSNPLQPTMVDVENLPSEKIFHNVLENALYKMAKINLEFSRPVQSKTKEEYGIELEFYQLLTGLKKHISTKRKDRFYYTYQISETYRQHLNRFFAQVDMESLKALRKPKATFLYLTLINLREAKKKTPYFDYLCKQAGINITDTTQRKRKLKKKLDLIRSVSDLNFDYKFNCRSGKYKYGIEINFKDSDIIDNNKEAVRKAFLNELGKYLLKSFKKKYDLQGYVKVGVFKEWLYSDSDFKFKRESYMKLCKEICFPQKEMNVSVIVKEAEKFFTCPTV